MSRLDQAETRVAADVLETFVRDLFLAAGVPCADAQTIAGAIISQEIRGNTTHGLRLTHFNLRGLADGTIRANPHQPVLSDRGMTAVIEGDHGVGIVGCMKGMRLAIDKAREGGIGIALVVRNNHFLAAVPYCLEAANAGMIGIAFSNTKGSMGYPGARGSVIGNTPMGFGIPTGGGFPILFDACMTASGGRMRQWIREGRRIPPDIQGFDRDGRPTDDPQAVIGGGTTLPIGVHKGAGLAILVEALTGVLGGAAFLSDITPRDQADRTDKTHAVSHCCIAIDVEAFMPVADFEARMADFIADLKGSPPDDASDEIRLPGERMERTRRECEIHGIPLEPDVREELEIWADRLGVPFPDTV